jgi:hypothetical protein
MADGDPLVLGATNDETSTTELARRADGPATALLVTNTEGGGVDARATRGGDGVAGTSDSGTGVTGGSDGGDGVRGRSTRGRGVYGRSDAGVSVQGDSTGGFGVGGYTQDGRGVFGGASGNGDAVTGFARSGNGVTGLSDAVGVQGFTLHGQVGVRGDAPDAVGVWGTGGGAGVVGSGSGTGVGVMAFATRDAVSATSSGARGVVGTTTAPGGTGVHGVATSPNAGGQVGVRGTSTAGFGVLGTSSTGIAGGFFGTVVVFGGFIAAGGFKAAAVPHPDGSHRLLYCLESPESWFEDVGRARLARGRAEVPLDPDFAAMIDTSDYHVFLTAEGETTGLWVADRTDGAFEVREARGGAGDAPFSYRVVGRRRDVDAPRLARVDLPDLPPEPAPAAEPPEQPRQSAPEPPPWPHLPWKPRRG